MNNNLITFLGDVYLPSSYRCEFTLINYVINLEYPITNYTNASPGKVNLKSSDCFVESTFNSKPLAVCLANNHMMDYRDKGLEDTINKLSAEGIRYYGAGTKENNHNNLNILTVSEVKIALLAYVCPSTSPANDPSIKSGVSIIDANKIRMDISEAKKQGVDRIIVSFHWGSEEVYLPKPDDVKLARTVVDMGVDLIVGHHSHCVQRYEFYNGRYIFYGLGNCIFPDIDVEAFFDEQSGISTRRYAKQQSSRNKQSLAVEFDVVTADINLYKLKFDGQNLQKKKRIKLNRNESIKIDDAYRNRYHYSYVYGKFRHSISRYLNNPTFPKVKHIRIIKDLISTKIHK